MKVLCVLAVFVAVAFAGPWPDDMAPPRFTVAPYAEDLDVAPYGVIDTVVDMIKGLLESGIAIKDKLENLVEQVNKVIDEITDFLEGIKDGLNPPDEIINEVFDKAIKEIVNVLDKVFDQIDSVFMTVVEYADEEIGDMWGADYAKMAVNKVVLSLYDSYVEKTVTTLQAAIDKVEILKIIPHAPILSYWDDFTDKLMGAIGIRMNERREDFAHNLERRIRRSVEALPDFPNKFKPQIPLKRSVSQLEELVYSQNPAAYIDEAECGVSTFGLASELKEALLKVQDVLVKAKTIITEFQDKVNLVIQTATDLRKQIQDVAGDQDALDFIMEKVQQEIEKLVLELIDRLMKEVTFVVRGIIEKVDAFISDKFCPFKEKVFKWLDDVIVSTVDNILSVLGKVLKLLNIIEEDRWDDVIDHIIDIAKGKITDMLRDVRQHIKDRLAQIGK